MTSTALESDVTNCNIQLPLLLFQATDTAEASIEEVEKKIRQNDRN